MRKPFRNFVLRFIPQTAFEDDITLSKHKLFVSVSFITVFFAAGYVGMNLFIHYPIGLMMMLCAVIYFSFSLYCFYNRPFRLSRRHPIKCARIH